MNLFTLYAKLGLDTSEYEKGIGKSRKSMTSLAQSISAKTVAMGTMAAHAIEGIGKAMISLGKSSIQASADIEAEVALYQQVFGELESAAGGVLEGISKDTNILATRLRGIGTSAFMQFKGAGVDAASALSAMDKYTRLAADAAAAFNMSIEDADVRMRSFLRGNTEAGDAIGLFTSESQRNERAIATYGQKWLDLTEAQKQMLMLGVVEELYEQQEIIGQAAREGHSWENVIGNLKTAFTNLLGTVGGPFREKLIPVIENLTGLFKDETFILRVGMLADGLGDIAGYVFDGVIGFIDEVLKWSNGEGEGGIVDSILNLASGLAKIAGLPFDAAKAFIASLIKDNGINLEFNAPTWEEVEEKMHTAVDSIVSGIKGIANWTLGEFGLPDVDTLIEKLKNWWTGKGSNTYERVKSIFVWTLGEFGNPTLDSIKTWWSTTGKPGVLGLLSWTLGEFVKPALSDIGTWWETSGMTDVVGLLKWTLGKFVFPTLGAVGEWWDNTGMQGVLDLLNWTLGEFIAPVFSAIVTSTGKTIAEWASDFILSVIGLLGWGLGAFETPDAEEVKAKILEWWEDLKKTLTLTLEPVVTIFTKNKNLPSGDTELVQAAQNDLGQYAYGWGDDYDTGSNEKAKPEATGLDYVPYNDYLARLHEGEAVLTKAEATHWRRGEAAGTVDTAGIASAVAGAVREALDGVGVYMGAERVGDLVTERVSRNIAQNARNRRYQPA